jgi:hypothetical protein
MSEWERGYLTAVLVIAIILAFGVAAGILK